ncbi:hypothetical protein ABW21_db0205769 [Orbilia brochopaga]|nr:hypothetical protein ABW21_db0205769 [Drechslerella brochopaga]
MRERDRFTTPCERIQMLTLVAAGGKAYEVVAKFGYSRSGYARLLRKAKNRGYNPKDVTSLKMEHVVDNYRSGRPRKTATQANEQGNTVSNANENADGEILEHESEENVAKDTEAMESDDAVGEPVFSA